MALLAAAFTSLPESISASEILVVVDSSGSMQETTLEGIRRIDAAKTALLQLSDTLQGHDVGMLLFGHRRTTNDPDVCQDIELRLPIGHFDEAEYKLTVAALQPRGATPIAESLLRAKDVLSGRARDTQKSIILVTDGNETCGGDPVAIARDLREAGFNVKVHVVGFGVDQTLALQLRAIADAGGGEFIAARNAEELTRVLPEIVTTALRTTQVEELGRNTLASDRFNGDELGDEWIVIRPDDDRYAAVDGELLIVSQHTGDTNDSPHIGDWHDDAKTKNLLQRREPLIANDYEVSVDLNLQLLALGQGAALQLRNDSGQAIELSYLCHPSGNNIMRTFMMGKVLDGQIATTSLQRSSGGATQPEPMTLKIVKRGMVFTGFVRIADLNTGVVTWQEVGMQAASGFDRAYPALKASNGWPNQPEVTAAFDNFLAEENVLKRTITDTPPADAAFFTVFENSEAFASDFEIRNEVPTHHGINGGLNLVSTHGIPGDTQNPVKNIVLLRQPLPSGNYDIEVQARTRLTNQNSDVGIGLFQDDQTGLYLGHAAFGGGGYNYNPQFQFEKVLSGKRSGPAFPVSHLHGQDVTVIFKIEKRGRKYAASVFAPDNNGVMQWMAAGEQTLLKFQPQLAFYAWNRSPHTYGRGPAHEVNICFERVVVRAVE